MPNLNVRMGDEIHAAWMDYCTERGLVSAVTIREYIEYLISEQEKPLRPKILRTNQKKRKVELWLTESEIEDIHLRTTLNSGTRAGWIIKVVRAALSRQPVFDDAETKALLESTVALNAIGKNLNQIARSLNKHEMPDRAVKFTQLVKDIDSHTDTVQALIDISRTRWKISA